MCDTIVVLPGTTATGGVLFGKNSDRERNKAQTVEFVARAQHADDARVNCTYIDVPQVRQTFAVLLCRPFWIWGAEMGANECGVVIGNGGGSVSLPLPLRGWVGGGVVPSQGAPFG
jgi:secernin